MELISGILMVLAVALLIALFVARPFLQGKNPLGAELASEAQKQEHLRSSLLAERDRVLTALQELDFDYALGKVPEDDYPAMRAALLRSGTDVLRKLDTIAAESAGAANSVEDRIEAAVAARRADARKTDTRERMQPQPEMAAAAAEGAAPARSANADALEDIIASRKRARSESAAGFCPKCGRPVSKSDKFCSKCGTTL